VIRSSARRRLGLWGGGRRARPDAAASANAMYSVVKELRWARRMTSATGRKQPRTTPHDYRCAVQRGSIYHRGVQAPPVRRADVELPKLPLKGCGPPRALVCGSRHAARSLMAIYCDLPMAMTLSSTRATCARNGARPSTATTHARMLADPVSADSAAVRGRLPGTREGLLPGRVCAQS
jgi:hypothetical protein